MDETSPALERLRAMDAHLLEPELFARVVESLPDALVIVGADGNVAFFNGQAELLFGWHRSEMLGKCLDVLVPNAARDRHAQLRDGFIGAPRTRPMAAETQLFAQHKNGHEIPVAINLAPIVAPSGTYVMAVVRRRV